MNPFLKKLGFSADDRVVIVHADDIGAYQASLAELRRLGGHSIAFPAISTGIYGYPKDQATKIAVETVRADLAAHGDLEVIFACFDEPMLHLYEKELAA